jgi:protein involved in polysaccharide export with SLBB domain
MGGQVARPGVFTLDPLSELTLKRAMVAAGGLNAIGIPERVDLIRRVGEGRQAVVRLNARAIWEGTQPDLMLKPDDVLNFGTNFWATPLAVVRGGFRASYGFGFLLDRNFGNDVFGAPPSNVGR